MLPPLPRCSGWASSSLVSPNRVSLPRFHVRIGLHIGIFEVCSAFTRVAACTLARSPYVVTAIRRLQTLRLLHACSGRFRRERSPGGACTHWKSAALSRRTWIADHGPRTTSARSHRSEQAHPSNRAERGVDGRALAGLSAEPKGRRRSSIAAVSRRQDPGHEALTASRPPRSDQNRRSARAQSTARSRETPYPEPGCSACRVSGRSD